MRGRSNKDLCSYHHHFKSQDIHPSFFLANWDTSKVSHKSEKNGKPNWDKNTLIHANDL